MYFTVQKIPVDFRNLKIVIATIFVKCEVKDSYKCIRRQFSQNNLEQMHLVFKIQISLGSNQSSPERKNIVVSLVYQTCDFLQSSAI